VDSATPARLTQAYDALSKGDVDQLVALLDDDVEWYGQTTGPEPPS
jgi:ketosteroid isomerase-like protein